MLVGMENLMCYFYTEPEAVREVLHHIMDFQMGMAKHYLEAGVEMVGMSDDLGNIEYAYSRMARDAGIEMPDTALLEGRCFAVKRFDVEEGRRLHMHSLAGLLQIPHERAAVSYDDLLQVTLNLTGRFDDAAKAYRLAVFNVLSHNRDDHIKNVAFLMDPAGRGRLATSLDLPPLPVCRGRGPDPGHRCGR